MRIFLFLALTSYIASNVQGRILFPEEVVSFLSFIYSIIPPIKLGKDSRFGAGFRVGPNADFQVLVELGPQSETQPLGPDGVNTRQARADRMGQQRRGNSTLRRTKVKKKKTKSNRSNKNTTRQETKPKQKIQ